MPLYLTQFSYTPAAWASLVRHPEDRRVAATQYIEAVRGTMHGFSGVPSASMMATPCGKRRTTCRWPPRRLLRVRGEP